MAETSSNENQPKESSSERLLKIAGVLDGWNVDSDGVDDMNIDFVEDEDIVEPEDDKRKVGSFQKRRSRKYF